MDGAHAAPEDGLSPDKARQILDGAGLVFAQDGYEGASMSRIAAEAGVSKGTLYNYFDGKAELFAAYVQGACSRRIALLFDDLSPDMAAEASLRLIGTRLLEMLISEESIVIYRMVVAEAEKFPELAQIFYAAGPARAVDHLAAWIRRAHARRLLAVDDPVFAAEQLFALMQTHLCMKRRLGLIKPPSRLEIDRVVEGAVTVFMRGYSVGNG